MADTRQSDDSDDKPERTTVDSTELAPRIEEKAGDTKGTAEGELAVLDNKTEEVKLDVNDTTLGATKGKTCNDKST